MQPVVAYVLLSPPASWFGYRSQFVPADEEQVKRAARVKLWREAN
jgi:hypothetical protein